MRAKRITKRAAGVRTEPRAEVRAVRREPKKHPSLEPLDKLRKLMQVVDRVQSTLERLIREIGSQTQDLRKHGQDLFYEGLEKNLKNKKNLKKKFESQTDPLLKKCGVKKKILTSEDVERIKSRFKLE